MILNDTASGLHFLHENLSDGVLCPIVHRDVKSDNILMSADFVCKLADFGETNLASKEYPVYCGTPGWMAPELIVEKQRKDFPCVKTDIYSFGYPA